MQPQLYSPDRRILAVTGAHDFMGSEVIKRLERDPRYHKILAIDIHKLELRPGKTEFHRIDLTLPAADTDLLQLFQAEQVDTVLHAAFMSAPTHNSTWAHELESLGTMHVLSAAAGCPVHRLVMWSQSLVYGPSPKNPNFLTEDHELSTSARSRFIDDKIEAERQVKYFARENPGIAVTVLRTAPLLGPTVHNFATRFFRRAVCPVLMGFDPLMQFIQEQDAIDAFLMALSGPQRGVFNIAADGVLPYSTVLAMMGRVPLPLPHFLAYPVAQTLWATQIFNTPPEFLDFLRFLCVVDTKKARDVLGFSPRHDIRATVEDFAGIESGATAAREMAT